MYNKITDWNTTLGYIYTKINFNTNWRKVFFWLHCLRAAYINVKHFIFCYSHRDNKQIKYRFNTTHLTNTMYTFENLLESNNTLVFVSRGDFQFNKCQVNFHSKYYNEYKIKRAVRSHTVNNRILRLIFYNKYDW